MVAACGSSGANGATATAIFWVNQTITADFRATRTTTAASVQAADTRYAQTAAAFQTTSTQYAQSSTRTASARAATVVGTARIGTAIGSAATPALSPTTAVASTPTATPPAAATFRDPAGRFSFAIPPGWSVAPSPVAGVIVSVISPAPRGSANVATEVPSGTPTLDTYAAATVATILGAHPGYRLAAGIQAATLGSYPARRYEIVGDAGADPVHFVQYVAFVGGTGYVLTLTAPGDDPAPFLGQAAVMVDSFAFGAAA
jgi:hypothetical protein